MGLTAYHELLYDKQAFRHCLEVAEAEKALFLRRFGVPFWALPYIFGHNDMYCTGLAAAWDVMTLWDNSFPSRLRPKV